MRRVIPAILIGIVLFVAVPLVSRYVLSSKRPSDVYELCGECGLTEAEIDRMIEAKRQSPLSRAEEIAAFEATFTDPGGQASAECLACAELILDRAGKTDASDSR